MERRTEAASLAPADVRGRRSRSSKTTRTASNWSSSGIERGIVRKTRWKSCCRDRFGQFRLIWRFYFVVIRTYFAVCGLLMPKRAQQSYFAIRAFNAELASVKDGSSLRRRGVGAGFGGGETTAATLAMSMRMQWWREAVGTIYGDDASSRHRTGSSVDPALVNLSISCWHSPVVRALDRANRESTLTRRFLERLIESREADLEVTQYLTMEESVNYAEHSVSSLLYLSLECAGVRTSQNHDSRL